MRPAAGYTTRDVPATISVDARAMADTAASMTPSSRDSPYMTMSGRICPPHDGHAGTGSPSTVTASPSDATVPQLVHTSRSQLPCSSHTARDPARWCRPSIFCVITASRRPAASKDASALCAPLGSTGR